jgi:hypothetical protein
VCNDVSITEFYVGSTLAFRKRKHQHKSICNNPNNKNYNVKIYEIIRENGGWDNWRMVIIEEMEEGTTLIQSRIREEYYRVELQATLNIQSAYTGLTKEEYKKEYMKEYNQSDKRKEYRKEYRQTNKEALNIKQREYRKEKREQALLSQTNQIENI